MKMMAKLKYNAWVTIALVLLFLIGCDYVAVACDFTGVQLLEIIQFILFCLVYIEAFGYILMRQLCNLQMYLSHKLLLSFFVGFVGTVFVYAICSFFSILHIFPFVIPLYIACVIAYKFHIRAWSVKRIHLWCKQCTLDNTAIFLFLEFLVACIVFQVLPKVNLETANKILLDADGTWHVSNIASLSHGLPAPEFRVLGNSFFYHYFTDLLSGICKNIFGIPAYHLFYFYMPFLVAALLSLSIWSLFRMASDKVLWLKCQCLFLSGMGITRVLVNDGAQQGSLFHLHLFTNINSVALITASMIAAIVYLDKVQNSEFTWKKGLIMGTLVGALSGFKGPIGLAFVLGLILVFVMKTLIEKKYTKHLLQYGVVSLLSFGVVYVFIIRGVHTFFRTNIPLSNTGNVTIDSMSTLRWTCLYDYLNELSYILLVTILYVLVFTPIVCIFVGHSLYKVWGCIRTKKVSNITDYFILALIYVGMGGYLLVAQSGYSQLYFLFMSIPLMLYYVLKCEWRNQKGIRILYWAVLAICFLFGAKDFGKDVIYRIRQADTGRGVAQTVQAANDEYHALTREEIEGLLWIRNNTDEQVIVISDRQALSRYEIEGDTVDGRFFGYSAIAERQMYLEGFYYSSISREQFDDMYEIQDCIYSGDDETVGAKMQQVGAEYLIVSKRFTDKTFSERTGVKLVFTNSDMDVYQYCK